MGSLHVPHPPCGTRPCAELLRQMATAAESHGIVGMAKGILMQSQGITADDAFQVLVQTSQHENRKLRLIAEELIGGASLRQAAVESSLSDLVGDMWSGGGRSSAGGGLAPVTA